MVSYCGQPMVSVLQGSAGITSRPPSSQFARFAKVRAARPGPRLVGGGSDRSGNVAITPAAHRGAHVQGG